MTNRMRASELAAVPEVAVLMPDPDAVKQAREWAQTVPGSRVAILPGKPDDLLVATGGDVDLLWSYLQDARVAA